MWQIQPGINFASQELLKFNLRPAHRLHLARQYDLSTWNSDAVRSLLQTSLQNYTNEDIEHMGMNIFTTIATAKEAISTERKRLANFAPYPKDFDNGPFCANHETCKRVWHEKWFFFVVPRCIHTLKEAPILLAQLPDVLESMDHSGVNPGCKAFIIDFLRNGHQIQVEETLISSTIDTVHHLLRNGL